MRSRCVWYINTRGPTTKSVSTTSLHQAIMAFKFIILCALVAASKAGYIAPQLYQAAAPAVATPLLSAKVIEADHNLHPQYSFAYDVQDSITGDYKSQHETRDGDIVQGSYSLLEADGTRRIVDYTADAHNGFNAIVHKEPATKVAVAQPIAAVAKVATPALTYGAPIQTLTKLATPISATYGAPSAIATPAYAPVAATYAAPPSYAYGAPTLAKLATPIAATSYTTASAALAAPVYASTYAAPIAKPVAPIAGTPVVAKYTPHPYIAHVTYTTPLFSYSL
ncbi:hypothetical protein PV327_008583 [Microctonus hyperodae]|uniref:Cuticle protein n=1 Tax=Microctonus hyperodae TaxID=165561 RepID=A0AA39F3G4_MICHY|nr:hypothetical protein PV327_008583 [Microctonus hyperodae]